MSGLETYNFEDKNRWRVKVWSRVAARVKNNGLLPREAIVLYLAGEEDLDRKVALRHGFNWHNMIAVDSYPQVIKQLRKDGKFAVEADIHDALRSWRSVDVRPNVMIIDLCCGLTKNLIFNLMSEIGYLSQPHGSVALINLQRGRDAETNFLRSFIPGGPLIYLYKQLGLDIDPKHRGRLLIWGFVGMMCAGLENKIDWMQQANGLPRFIAGLKPVFLSYRSNQVTMDSVLMTLSATGGSTEFPYAANTKVSRRIAATLATRTRTINDIAVEESA